MMDAPSLSFYSGTARARTLRDKRYRNMASLLDSLMEQLNGTGAAAQLAGRLGVDEGRASGAMASAIPAILAGLANNTAKPKGAAALNEALGQHDGSVFDDAGTYFADDRQPADGDKILGHVFGAKKGAVEGQVAALSGLNAGQGAQLMAMLAPLIMGFLGKQKSSGGMDASALSKLLGAQSGDLGKLLQGPLGDMLLGGGKSGGLGGMLGKLLGRR